MVTQIYSIHYYKLVDFDSRVEFANRRAEMTNNRVTINP